MQSININNQQLEALVQSLGSNKKLQGFITNPANILAAIKAAKAGEWFPSESELIYASTACINSDVEVEFGRMPELSSMLSALKDWALNIVGSVKGAVKRIWGAIRSRFTSAPERGALLALKWASHGTTAPAVVLCWLSRVSTQAKIDEILG